MEITKTIQPGEMGSKRLLQQYGEQLVCVRYRIDKYRQRRVTTVELIIDEKPYHSNKPITIAWIKVHYNESELRKTLIEAGARWLPEYKIWEMEYKTVKKMRLTSRIVKKVMQ